MSGTHSAFTGEPEQARADHHGRPCRVAALAARCPQPLRDPRDAAQHLAGGMAALIDRLTHLSTALALLEPLAARQDDFGEAESLVALAREYAMQTEINAFNLAGEALVVIGHAKLAEAAHV